MKIETRDSEGNPNGWLLPIWSALENPEWRPEQVYLTAVAPYSRKGPHLHLKRRGMFVCVSGAVTLRLRTSGDRCYLTIRIQPGSLPVHVLPGTACAIYNHTEREALLLNMPAPAWSSDDPDEHPVADWKDPGDWK